MEVSREVVSVVSVRHASGVEDSFLWPPKFAFGGTSLKSNFASSFYSKQRERKREEQRARNTIASNFNYGGFCKQRSDPCVCVYIARRQNLPKFLCSNGREEEKRRRQNFRVYF